MFPTTAAYTAPTASTGERTNPYMATGMPPGMGTGTGVGVPRLGSEAQKTYTGASEPETTTAANAQEVPIDTGITENDSGVGAAPAPVRSILKSLRRLIRVRVRMGIMTRIREGNCPLKNRSRRMRRCVFHILIFGVWKPDFLYMGWDSLTLIRFIEER